MSECRSRITAERAIFGSLLLVWAGAAVACGDSPDGPGADGGGTDPRVDATAEDARAADTEAPRPDSPSSRDGADDAQRDRAIDPTDVRTDMNRPPDGNSPPDTLAPRDASTEPDASSTTGDGGRLDVTRDAATGTDAGVTPEAGPSHDGSRPGWNLIWSDEFDAASGTGADPTKWNLVNKGDGFGNNELQFYTNRTANAYHDGNGFLVIKAMKESYMGREYTSARLESNGKFERTYGRFESRLQVPRGQGIWPAVWMLGNDIGTAGWPTCGEIDVMENIGKEPSTVHGTLHGPGYSGGNPLGYAYTLPGGQKLADAFHTFAVEWEQNVVRFYIDDILYGTRTPADVPSGGRWVYDHPFYLLLNVAVGGNWPGAPDGTTVFPQMLTIDYVRVYSR
jgi:beta-glucanase (GH16 family)